MMEIHGDMGVYLGCTDYVTYFPNVTSPILENQMERGKGEMKWTLGITQILMAMGSL